MLTESVITQKRMIPYCSNLLCGMTVGYLRNDMIWGFQAHRLGLRQQKYGVDSKSVSTYQ